jgi:hypothetical protein
LKTHNRCHWRLVSSTGTSSPHFSAVSIVFLLANFVTQGSGQKLLGGAQVASLSLGGGLGDTQTLPGSFLGFALGPKLNVVEML